MDKTVLNTFGPEHRGFDWLLSHKKYLKPDGTNYTPERDYFGFFPLKNDSFYINDLSRFTESQLDSLSTICDVAYYTDTYGIY